VRAGADLNITGGRYLRTPLHLASAAGHPVVCRLPLRPSVPLATSLTPARSLLLAEASDPYVEDSFGYRPQDVAKDAATKAAFGSTFVKTVVDAMHVTIDNIGSMNDIHAQVFLFIPVNRLTPHRCSLRAHDPICSLLLVSSWSRATCALWSPCYALFPHPNTQSLRPCLPDCIFQVR
jgi:hypothetical protein